MYQYTRKLKTVKLPKERTAPATMEKSKYAPNKRTRPILAPGERGEWKAATGHHKRGKGQGGRIATVDERGRRRTGQGARRDEDPKGAVGTPRPLPTPPLHRLRQSCATRGSLAAVVVVTGPAAGVSRRPNPRPGGGEPAMPSGNAGSGGWRRPASPAGPSHACCTSCASRWKGTASGGPICEGCMLAWSFPMPIAPHFSHWCNTPF